MGNPSLLTRLRLWLGGLGFKLFLWSNNFTWEKYVDLIYESERRVRTQDKKFDGMYLTFPNGYEYELQEVPNSRFAVFSESPIKGFEAMPRDSANFMEIPNQFTYHSVRINNKFYAVKNKQVFTTST